MADVTYKRTFKHDDWVDNEDVVQADGERGFNRKFHELEFEFDTLGTVIDQVNAAITNIPGLAATPDHNQQTLAPKTLSTLIPIDTYNTALLPQGMVPIYYAAIFPADPNSFIAHSFVYQQISTTLVAVSIRFSNPGDNQAIFTFKVVTLKPKA